jgi:hypothetical protein
VVLYLIRAQMQAFPDHEANKYLHYKLLSLWYYNGSWKQTEPHSVCPLNWLPQDPTVFASLVGSTRTVSPRQSQWVEQMMGCQHPSWYPGHTALCQVPALWASCLSSLDSPSFYLPHLFYAHSWASSSRPVTLNSTHTTNDSITNPPSQSLHLYQKWVSNMTSRKISPRVFTAVNSITQLLRPQTQEPPIHLPVEGLLPLTHTHNHKWKLLLCQCSC